MNDERKNDGDQSEYMSLKIWGKGFLIFSAILILIVTIIFIIRGPQNVDEEQMDFERVLNADSLEEIKDIRDEEINEK